MNYRSGLKLWIKVHSPLDFDCRATERETSFSVKRGVLASVADFRLVSLVYKELFKTKLMSSESHIMQKKLWKTACAICSAAFCWWRCVLLFRCYTRAAAWCLASHRTPGSSSSKAVPWCPRTSSCSSNTSYYKQRGGVNVFRKNLKADPLKQTCNR